MEGNGLKYIEDKVFLVTGGAAGVGAGIVRALLANNARHVVFLDIAEREGTSLETELLTKFGALKAKFVKCDISNEHELDAAFKQVVNKYHRLDAVVNNAAVSADDEAYKRVIDINLTATISSTLKSLNIMGLDKGGSGGTVLNVSSLLALKQTSDLSVYGATKVAVLQFSNSIGAQRKFAKTNVRVVTVCLGPTDTAIRHRQSLDNSDKDLTSRPVERQRVESAVSGIIEVISRGETGSTWMVANDNPAVEITNNVKAGYEILSGTVKDTILDL